MTWNDFKKAVDAALADRGKTGDVKVRYIDVSNQEVLQLSVNVDKNDSSLAVF